MDRKKRLLAPSKSYTSILAVELEESKLMNS
jgi:hypothetical protein